MVMAYTPERSPLGGTLYAYGIVVEFSQYLRSKTTGDDVPGVTWQRKTLGVVGRDNVRGLRDIVKDYVDKFANKYGGKGYRVFIGRKANMKQVDLTDVASDSAGEVFSTKTGDLRLTHTIVNEATADTIVWVRGEKKTPLIVLDTDVNSAVIWSDLGIYKFVGTMCDNP